MKKKLLLLSFVGSLSMSAVNAQDFKMPSPSPIQTINQQFSTSNIEVSYSRPSMKGRVVFGDLVPFGKMWRTGANGATTVSFKEDVFIEGEMIPAGTYAIYTIPEVEYWTVILNKGHKNWGLSGYKEDENIARIKVPIGKNPEPIETFTITIDNLSNNYATMTLAWEFFNVKLKIKADNNNRILSYLEKELKGEKPPYQQAANYYLENNYKLDDAIKYTDAAIAANKDAFWLHWLKARIYAKMGNKTEALRAAALAAEKSKDTDYEKEYSQNYERLKQELQ